MSGIRVTLFTREGQIINTTDGTEPHVANGFVYKSDNPLVITKTTTVCAVAYAGSTPEVMRRVSRYCHEYSRSIVQGDNCLKKRQNGNPGLQNLILDFLSVLQE